LTKRVGTGLLRAAGIIGLLTIAVPLTSGAGHAVAASKAPPQTTQNLTKRGTTNLKSISPGNGSTLGSETATGPEADAQIPKSGLGGTTRVPANHVPTPAANAIASSNTGFSGFAGLTHFDQRTSGTGTYANTNYSLEPPDQGLCVGGGFVVEAINTAVRVFDTSGSPLTSTVSLNQFFQVAPAIDRTQNPLVRGDFTSDAKCYYDGSTHRWFLTMLDTQQRQSDGASLAPTEELIAVSQTPDPTGNWTTFSFYTTDDGTNGTPTHPNCPCLGDQPLIGADQNGFYISTNEFELPVLGNGFNGTQIYAFAKSALEAAATAAGTPSSGQTTGGTIPTVTHIDVGALATPDQGGIWYSLQPATVPEGGSFATGNNGTEYFLSALQFFSNVPLDNRIAVWALTNTASLNTATPSFNLTDQVISSEVYGQPGDAQQKSGVTPLGDTLTKSTLPENNLAGNDVRMNQVVFANGILWSGVNTVLQPQNGPTRLGIAYFIVTPSVNAGQVSGTMANQGYVAANQENVMYPSIGVNTSGQGVIGFTLVGPDYYPSAGYAKVDATNGAGAIHIAAAGVGPADGFTGYTPEGGTGRSERWGDYSAAVADASGKIWIANEYIGQACSDAAFVADSTCGGTRTQLANWGTFISQVTP
jgi:hypothetical protein